MKIMTVYFLSIFPFLNAFGSHLFPPEVYGLLLDMDGTLVDSDRLHYDSFRETLLDLTPSFNDGIPITREFYNREISGSTNSVIGPKLHPNLNELEIKDFITAKEQLFLKKSTDLRKIDGLDDFLTQCVLANKKCVIVTNAPRVEANHMLKLLELQHLMDDMVIGGECEFPKPHPAPYLSGLKKLGLLASNCIAFEDSKNGCLSSVNAGIFTIGVATSRSESELISYGASLVIHDFCDSKLLELLNFR